MRVFHPIRSGVEGKRTSGLCTMKPGKPHYLLKKKMDTIFRENGNARSVFFLSRKTAGIDRMVDAAENWELKNDVSADACFHVFPI